jgi:protein gp37
MAKDTAIQWCDSTCNPSMGCDGCELWDKHRQTCYAGTLHETRGKKNKGFAPSFDKVTPFPGRMMEAAAWPDLRGAARPDKPWLDGSPRTIFVSDMGDSLSQAISFDYLLKEVVEVAESERGQRHSWQWLTKRPQRMAEFSAWLKGQGRQWPVNLWVGTSITTASSLARVAKLLCVGDETTTRFLSVEPQVEAVDLGEHLRQLDWIIQGGESGRDARPFDLVWARTLLRQCRQVGVPYFLKQVGAVVHEQGQPISLRDSHGGAWSEWPEDLRVREIPCGKGARKRLAQSLAELEDEPTESEEAAQPEPTVREANESDAGADDDGIHIDLLDSRGLENELNGVIGRLADDMSELALVKLLPRAKELYERLHPETRHGGPRDQVARSATWPSFATYVAAQTGISKRTVYTRLEIGEQLVTLDPAAEVASFGMGLANQIGLLVRIARIPDGTAQRDLVAIYRSAGPKKTRAELAARESAFGIKPKRKSEPESKPPEGPEVSSDAKEEQVPPASDVEREDNAPDLGSLIAALGVAEANECLPAIEALKEAETKAHELRQLLTESEAGRKKLEKELALYRTTPMGELFGILGVTNAKDALRKVRSLTEASSAAE